MLVPRAMTRSILAVMLLAASGTAASAGTYLGLGIGSNARLDGQMGHYSDGGDRSGRLILGQSFGRLAIEGTATRYDLGYGVSSATGTSLAAALKLSLPLGNNFELFGKGGLQRTSLSGNDPSLGDLSGNGYLLGAGFEYKLDFGLGGGSIFVDYQRNKTSFDLGTSQMLDGTVSMWTLGITLAI